MIKWLVLVCCIAAAWHAHGAPSSRAVIQSEAQFAEMARTIDAGRHPSFPQLLFVIDLFSGGLLALRLAPSGKRTRKGSTGAFPVGSRAAGGTIMLTIAAIDVAYGPVQVLRSLTLEARAGEVTCVMGRNGVGKSTLMKAIAGQLPVTAGQIVLDGVAVSGLAAHEVPRQGIGYVPQGRRLFGDLTVAENLEIGLMCRGRGPRVKDHVLTLFPRLRERLGQVARTLSGGEQQMLAIARALCLEPKVLLLDEPTEGLQPSMIALIRDVVRDLRATGVATILVEQRVEAVLSLADRVAFMAGGRVAEVVEAAGLTAAAPQFQTYVGV